MKNSLGLGCSKLSHQFTTQSAVRNLEIAYDYGIKHFDIARSYGFGAAERILGSFIKNKRDKLTITTKVGVTRHNRLLKNLLIQNTARKFSNFINNKKINQSSITKNNLTSLCLKVAKQSLENSLKELGTDYVDFLLLHSPISSDFENDGLFSWLEDMRNSGKILNYGIGAYGSNLVNAPNKRLKNVDVIQTNFSFPDEILIPKDFFKDKTIFLFAPFKNSTIIHKIFKEHISLRKEASNHLGFDPWYISIDMELSKSHNSISPSNLHDQFNQRGVDITFQISKDTLKKIERFKKSIKKILERNNLSFVELNEQITHKKLEDVYHPFNLYGGAGIEINKLINPLNNLHIFDTGLLNQAGGINPTASIFCLIENHVDKL